MKYFVINRIKSVQDLQAENYKSLMKVINEDISKWRDIMFMDVVKQIFKMSIFTNWSTDSM